MSKHCHKKSHKHGHHGCGHKEDLAPAERKTWLESRKVRMEAKLAEINSELAQL